MSHPSVRLLTFPRIEGTILLQPAEPFVQGLPRQTQHVGRDALIAFGAPQGLRDEGCFGLAQGREGIGEQRCGRGNLGRCLALGQVGARRYRVFEALERERPALVAGDRIEDQRLELPHVARETVGLEQLIKRQRHGWHRLVERIGSLIQEVIDRQDRGFS